LKRSNSENFETTLIKLDNIYKTYKVNNAEALKGMTLEIKSGTVHALIGENGAGKTSLMKILCGVEKKDKGEIYIRGSKVDIRNPMDSYNLGIGMIYQHFRLIDDFSVSENIVLGNEEFAEKFYISNFKRNNRIKKTLDTMGIEMNLNSKVKDLSVGEKQIVEILRVLLRGAEILIFDEPTAVLGEYESKKLFKLIRNLKKIGKSIIFISHKFKEIKEISDEITVMSNGVNIYSGETKQISPEFLTSMLSGNYQMSYTRKNSEFEKEKVLEITGLYVDGEDRRNTLNDVSFNIKSGEIIGIAGMSGNGQILLAETIIGMNRSYHGEIRFRGKDLKKLGIRKRRLLGMGYVPEDRLKEGVSLVSSLEENLIADKYFIGNYGFKGKKTLFSMFLNRKRIEGFSEELLNTFKVKYMSGKLPVGMLSGGNIQKVVLAREISSNPDLLIICEPTRGLDLNSADFVYEQIFRMKQNGISIILISSNFDEIVQLSDRICVMYEGSITESIDEINEENLKLIKNYVIGYKQGV